MAGKIFITGDCHAEFGKFNAKNFPDQFDLDKDDYVIICGDFGAIWSAKESKSEKHWLAWLDADKNYTTLFIDGNHENFDRLNSDYPVKEWNGGLVHEIRPKYQYQQMLKEVQIMKQIIEKTKLGKQSYEVSTYLTSERILSLFGEVNDEIVNELIQQIIALNLAGDEEITILINSSGGSISAGLALCDVMRLSKAPIKTVAVSIAASMAAVILCCGTKGRREILPSARVMIHDPRVLGNMGVVTVKDAVELGKNLNVTKQKLNAIIAENTGKSIKQINKDTSWDHYFAAEEAIEYGLCDKFVEWF